MKKVCWLWWKTLDLLSFGLRDFGRKSRRPYNIRRIRHALTVERDPSGRFWLGIIQLSPLFPFAVQVNQRCTATNLGAWYNQSQVFIFLQVKRRRTPEDLLMPLRECLHPFCQCMGGNLLLNKCKNSRMCPCAP